MSQVRKLNVLSGIRPRFPDSLLPEHTATIAKNCDFAYGELRNTKDGFPISSTRNIPKSIYTDDGVTFYTWERDVDAVRAPMANDTFKRMYYTDGTGIRVASRNGTRIDGGEPGSSYKAGVPRPKTAPVLTIPALPDLATAKLEWFFHYEYAGVKYQEQAISPTVITENESWSYTPPALLGGQAIEPFTYGAKSYIKTATVSSVTSDGTAATTTQAQATSQTANQEYTLPTGTYIKVLNAETIQVIEPGRTYSDSGVHRFYDDSGQVHEVESIFTIQTYGFIKDRSINVSSKTPVGAVPVLRIKGTSKIDGAQLFDIYTTNSSFAGSGTLWTLLSSRVSNADEYKVTLNRGIKEADKETRAYVYCYVNLNGEPGPPSDASLVTTSPIVDVNVQFELDDVAAAGYVPIKEVWIYRTPSGSTIADYFFVDSVSVLSDGPIYSYRDNLRGAELNEPLSSDYYYPPPDGLVGLMSLPNGILCAWRDNELWFSEAFKPWAWPPAYCKPLSHKIVGGISHGAGAVIITVQQPYLVSGVSPDSMTASRLNIAQAGVSKWAIASVDGCVIYASNDGLVTLNGVSASLDQSSQFFTRDVWRSLYGDGLSSMRFSVWDGRLVVFSSENKFTPFMIRFDEANGTMTELPSLKAACAFISLLSDQFYYASGKWVYQFNGGNELEADWQSRELVERSPINFGFAQAIVIGDWTVKFYADDELQHEEHITTGTTGFRLPSGFLSTRWKVRISGRGRMRELAFAKTAADLKNG